METSGPTPSGEALRRAASVLSGNGSHPEDPVLAGIRRERQARYGEAGPAGLQEADLNLGDQFFVDVTSGIGEDLKDKAPKFDVKGVAKNAYERVSNVRVLGQPLVDMAAGSALGFGVRTAARVGLFAAGASGVAPAVAGAIGGASVEAFKRIRAENRGYREFSKKLTAEFEDLVNGQFGTANVATLVKRFQEIELQKNAETNSRNKEALYDQMRYLGVYMKRSEKGQEVNGKALLDAYFESRESEIANNQTEADQLLKAIKETKLVDRRKLAWAVGRGAAFGAVGGVVGAAVADWFAHSEINPFRAAATAGGEAASAGKEAAKATVSPPSAPPAHETIQETILPKESVTVPAGSDSLKFTNDAITQELTKRLGHPPTNKELLNAFSRVIADSKIENVTGIPAGTKLNLEGLKDIVDVAKGLKPDIAPSIAAQPEIISLPKGSNGWEIAERLIKEVGGKGTFDEIKAVDYALSKASGVAVPTWDLPGQIDHRFLPVGFEFHENTDVKVLLTQIHDGNFHPQGSVDVGAPRVAVPVAESVPKIHPTISHPEAPLPEVTTIPDISTPQAPTVPAAEVIPPSHPVETPQVPGPVEVKPPVEINQYALDYFTNPANVKLTETIPPGVKITLAKLVEKDILSVSPYPHLPVPEDMIQKAAVQLAHSSGLDYLPNAELPAGAGFVRDKAYKNIILSLLPRDTSLLLENGVSEITTGGRETSFFNESARTLAMAMGEIADDDEIIHFAKALQKSSSGIDIYKPFKGIIRFDKPVKDLFRSIITAHGQH